MKTITVCGSISHFKGLCELKEQIESLGDYIVLLPHSAELVYQGKKTLEEVSFHQHIENSEARKLKKTFMKRHLRKIEKSDAIIVANFEKNGIKNYIGGNTFMEMGFAFTYQKPIFILNEVPEMPYTDEITGTLPIVLHGKLEGITEYFLKLPKVFVGTTSAIKLSGVQQAINEIGLELNVEGIKVESGIADQPIGFEQTLQGAKNRLQNLKDALIDKEYEYIVAVEAGIVELSPENHFDMNICLIENKKGVRKYTFSTGFHVQEQLYKEIIEKNLELGPYFQEKYGVTEKDPFVYVTNKAVNRSQVITQAVKVALSRLRNER